MPNQTIFGNLGIGTAPFDDPRLKFYVYNATEMACFLMKVGGDRGDINVDGAAIVKHSKDYTATPGYAHTMQVYGEGGVAGLILGDNDFVGVTEPYVPTPAAVPNGFVRFELGPLWPYSEVARFNNRGDFILGFDLVRKFVGSQAGFIVTNPSANFTAGDVGKFVTWGDYETGGKDSHADRILEFIDAAHVRVETTRTIASQGSRVCSPRVVVRTDGGIELKNSTPAATTRDDAGVLFVQDGALKFRGAAGTVTTVAPA